MLIVAALVLAFQGSKILGAHDVKFSSTRLMGNRIFSWNVEEIII